MSPFVTEDFRNASIGLPTEAGIKGWLFILVLVLLCFSPIRVALSLGEYSDAIEAVDDYNSEDYDLSHLSVLFQVEMVSSILFALFSIFAGVMLSTRNADGAIVAKAYFRSAIVFTILMMVVVFFIHLPSEISSEVRIEYTRDSLISLTSLSLWLLYIYRSKRVKATFPDTALNR